MKKLIVSALMALSCGVLFAADTDMYLYWMIADDADLSFTDKDGVKIETPELSGYNARIAYGEGQYLNLYESVGGDPAGSFNAYDAQGWDMLAGVGGFEGNTFFVELFNAAEGTAYKSAPVDYGALEAYMSTMKGQARPADTYGFKSFTAVPEPTSGLLLLLGVAGLALRRKNKKA